MNACVFVYFYFYVQRQLVGVMYIFYCVCFCFKIEFLGVKSGARRTGVHQFMCTHACVFAHMLSGFSVYFMSLVCLLVLSESCEINAIERIR